MTQQQPTTPYQAILVRFLETGASPIGNDPVPLDKYVGLHEGYLRALSDVADRLAALEHVAGPTCDNQCHIPNPNQPDCPECKGSGTLPMTAGSVLALIEQVHHLLQMIPPMDELRILYRGLTASHPPEEWREYADALDGLEAAKAYTRDALAAFTVQEAS